MSAASLVKALTAKELTSRGLREQLNLMSRGQLLQIIKELKPDMNVQGYDFITVRNYAQSLLEQRAGGQNGEM